MAASTSVLMLITCCTLRVAGARAIRLADEARADGDQQVGVLHGVVAAEWNPLSRRRSCCVGGCRGCTPEHERAGHRHGVGQLQELSSSGPASRAPPPTRTTTRSALRQRLAAAS